MATTLKASRRASRARQHSICMTITTDLGVQMGDKLMRFEIFSFQIISLIEICGGGGGIRTHGGVSPTSVFKTGALNHSATPPTAVH